jgi:hypothetical protein
MPEKVKEKYPEMEKSYEELWRGWNAAWGYMRRPGCLPCRPLRRRQDFSEEVHQKQGAQSAPRTLMGRWFERPDTSTIYVLTVYPPFFPVLFVLTGLPRGKSSRCRGSVVLHFSIGLCFRYAVVFHFGLLFLAALCNEREISRSA